MTTKISHKVEATAHLVNTTAASTVITTDAIPTSGVQGIRVRAEIFLTAGSGPASAYFSYWCCARNNSGTVAIDGQAQAHAIRNGNLSGTQLVFVVSGTQINIQVQDTAGGTSTSDWRIMADWDTYLP